MKFIQWRPGIGDPDFMGCFITCSYIIVAMMSGILCIWGERFFSIYQLKKQQFFWGFLGIIFLFLGINKQLDLQSLLRDVGKALALDLCWYDQRRIVQIWFFILIGSIFFILLVVTAVLLIRKGLNNNLLAMFGLFIIMVFILIRAASFNHIEKIFKYKSIGHKMNLFLELSGIICVAINALMYQKSKNQKSKN